MIKNPCKFICLIAVLIASCSGCETGTHIITGKLRPAIRPEFVQIFPAIPANGEIVGIVTAEIAWNSQSQVDYGVGILKKQAASIGANGLLIGNTQTSPGSFSSYSIGTTPVFYSNPGQTTMQGTAIFVP